MRQRFFYFMMLSCSTNLILIIFTHPTSSKRAYICNFLNFSARTFGKKILNAFCLHENKKEKIHLMHIFKFPSKNYTQKLFIISSHLYYTTLSTIYSHVCASWHTQSVKEKVQRTNSRLFYFEE